MFKETLHIIVENGNTPLSIKWRKDEQIMIYPQNKLLVINQHE